MHLPPLSRRPRIPEVVRFSAAPAVAAAALLLAAGVPFLTPAAAQRIEDDFDDGNDDDWTRLTPLEELGVTASFTFPGGNTLRIATTPSPDPGAWGAARAGSLREDAEFGPFRVSIDILDWAAGVHQDAGILARVANVGLGTTDGYAWSLEFPGGLYLSVLSGEAPTTLGEADFTPIEGHDYRLVFHGFGPDLLGQCFDLASPETPVAEVYAWDSLFDTGPTGIFVNAARDTDGTDATFDRFRADDAPDTDADGLADPWEQAFFGNLLQNAAGDPDGDQSTNGDEFAAGTSPIDAASRFRVHSVIREQADLVVDFTIMEDREYSLERSGDGTEWDPDPGAVFSSDGESGRFVTAVDGVLPGELVRVRVVRP